MSISNALNNALSGLAVNSRVAEVTSSNLSNALTDGYARRGVELVSSQRGGVGGGVRVEALNRFVDAGLLADRRLADAALTGQQRNANALNRLEQTLGNAEDPASLGGRLAQLEQAFIQASSDPGSETRLSAVFSRLDDVTITLRANDRAIQGMRQEADAAIARDVDVLNSALEQVASFNKDILRLKATGTDPSSLMDARQNVVDQIAEIVPVRELVRENNTISLMTTTGTMLLDSRPVVFGFDRTPTITADMTFAAGSLSGLTLDGDVVSALDGIGRLNGGSIGASFALRDQTLVEAQSSLDGIAADLIVRFQDPANDPTLAAGDPGLLTDLGGVLDPLDIPGLAGRITINAAIDPTQGGSTTLLRDGLNAVAAGPLGNTAQLNRWVAAIEEPRADIAGSAMRSAAGRIADFTTLVGSTRVKAEEQLSYTAARWDTLHEAELAQGVDTDLELQTLLRVEQAYAANAKVIETVDFMMQRLMEI